MIVVKKQSLYFEKPDIKVVYTPLHGTGNIPVRRVLDNFNVTVVTEQELPDGDFSTVRSPNPEEKDALTLAISKAREIDADTVTDFSKGVFGLPRSNVLKFVFSNGSWVAIRPSGTEPKIKIYYSQRAETVEKAEQELDALRKIFLKFFE